MSEKPEDILMNYPNGMKHRQLFKETDKLIAEVQEQEARTAEVVALAERLFVQAMAKRNPGIEDIASTAHTALHQAGVFHALKDKLKANGEI